VNRQFKEFIISDDKKLIQLDRVCTLLSTSYWANDRSRETIQLSIENSLCFGVYHGDMQIGFARCVTDYATIYWLGDVIIDSSYRGIGLGKALVSAVVEHEQLAHLGGTLGTNDAHGLYEKYGFRLSDNAMRRTGK
jgi:GNAT superfamily N-acetyltransferase